MLDDNTYGLYFEHDCSHSLDEVYEEFKFHQNQAFKALAQLSTELENISDNHSLEKEFLQTFQILENAIFHFNRMG